MVHENYNLTWHTYSDHLRDMMQEIFRSDDFKDVTLVSDDKQSIKAHRNILSTCSPVFKSILQMEGQSNHPVIYLKGIKYSEIDAILKFIYSGETKCHEKELNELMLTAKNLEIKELCETVNIWDEVNDQKKDKAHLLDAVIKDEAASSIETKTIDYADNENGKEDQPVEEIFCENESKTFESVQRNEHQPEKEELLNAPSEDAFPTKTKTKTKKIVQTKRINYGLDVLKVQCPNCDNYFANKWVLGDHIKSIHEGVTYACNHDQCYKEYALPRTLRQHIQSAHEGVKFPCNQCQMQFSTKNGLNIHTKAVHKGVKYNCNHCDRQYTDKSSLIHHTKAVHKGVIYNCEQCEFKSPRADRLSQHVETSHEGVRFACNQCDHKATQKDNLRQHIQRRHSTIKFDPKMYEIKVKNI